MSLVKATLQPLHESGTKPEPAIPVQFNPGSLSIQLQNNIDAGPTEARQAEQYTGTGSATLTLDLHFDTADEGTTERPVNVRTKTATVARFVLPQTGPGKHAPPRVRFQWGEVLFEGAMTSFSETLDLFSSCGVPLRAKVSVSISGQNPAFEALAIGPGAAQGAGASLPGGGALGFGGGAGLGVSAGFGASVGGAGTTGGAGAPRVGVALGGESPAAFAARMGLDAQAWRALAAPGGLGLSLDAGTEVAFPMSAGTAPGVGSARGDQEAGGAAALERAVEHGGAGADRAASGFALAAAGGVDAATQAISQARANAASGAQREAFGVEGGPAERPAGGSAGAGARAPLHSGDLPRPRALGPPASPPPRADARATSFGLGVPLRPRRGDLAVPRAALARRAPLPAPAPPAPRHGPGGDCSCGCGGGA